MRTCIYEGVDKGLFEKLARGVYRVHKDNVECLLMNGDGRDLSFIHDNSILSFLNTKRNCIAIEKDAGLF